MGVFTDAAEAGEGREPNEQARKARCGLPAPANARVTAVSVSAKEGIFRLACREGAGSENADGRRGCAWQVAGSSVLSPLYFLR
jgi:hypothetical protein